MANFSYKAYDSSGAKVDGQLEAKDKTSALIQLKKQQLLTSELKQIDKDAKALFSFSGKVSLADLEFLTSELSLLLSSDRKSVV